MTSTRSADDVAETDHDERQRAIAIALRHVNASTPRPLTAADLEGAIRSGEPPAAHDNEIFAFVDETDTATLCDLVTSGAATYDQLAALAERLLLPDHPTRVWLHERRYL